MTDTHDSTLLQTRPRVSFADEQLLLVNAEDQVVGYADKVDAHRGTGVRHRAFSVFLFDTQERVLVHRRSLHKPLWPGFWTNSCCSHPRRGETLDSAVRRRLREELGVTDSAPQHVYQFEYRAEYGDQGTEHELCHVFFARMDDTQVLNPHSEELMDWCWLSVTTVDTWMRDRPQELTPWFRQEWSALRGRYATRLNEFMRAYRPAVC